MDNIDKVNAILAKADQVAAEDPDLIYLSNGVVLKAVPVPPFLLNDLLESFKEPAVPTIPGENGMKIPNPSDLQYLRDMETFEKEKGTAYTETLVGAGTRLVSVPDSISPLEDDGWVEDAEFILKRDLARKGRARYLAWVKYVLIDTNKDLENIAKRVSAKMGVSEAAVDAAMQKFRDQSERQTDPDA